MPGMPGTILESKEIMINKITEDVATILPRSSREEGFAAPAAGRAVSRGLFTSHVIQSYQALGPTFPRVATMQ